MDNFVKVAISGRGLRLAADAIGNRDAPVVLFFHGGGQRRNSWRGTARKIAQAGYHACTIDLRGHGDSDWAIDGDYSLEAYVQDIECVLSSFDRPTILVGASRGGQAALIASVRHPGHVKLVMLADVAPLIANLGIDRIRRFFDRSLEGFASIEEAIDVLSESFEKAPVTEIARLRKAMRVDGAGRLFWHWDPKTVSRSFINPPSDLDAFESAAAHARMPVVLVRAEFSDIVTPESVQRFCDLTPQLIVVEAEGVGHMMTGDRNDSFANTLLDFLARFAPLQSV